MTIVYETDKMTALMNTESLIEEMVILATSATGSAPTHGGAIFEQLYRDKKDCWIVTARDDAASNKLVGVVCFGDLNSFSHLDRSKGGWRNTIRDAIVAKGIDDDADVSVSVAIYVHADYNSQGIAKTMRNKKAEYQTNRGVTHSISNAFWADPSDQTTIKSWGDAMIIKIGGETIGTDSDGNNIYLCPHGTSL
jgi:hypothetical protein